MVIIASNAQVYTLCRLLEPVSIIRGCRMGEGFCCPARRKNADNTLCIARFFNAAGRQKTRSDGVEWLWIRVLNSRQKPAIAQSVQDGHAARNKAAISKPPTAIPTTDPEVPVSISWQPKICFQPNALRSFFLRPKVHSKGIGSVLQTEPERLFTREKLFAVDTKQISGFLSL